ncbi:MAG: HD domain-containing phosphohydrolase [Planctomycetota bacterium]
MLRVAIREAAPGMRLALPVYHPRRPGTVLLKAGVALDEKLIERLREIELKEVWINYPGMAFLGRFVSPEMQRARSELSHHILSAIDVASSGALAELDYTEYRRAIVQVVEQLLRSPSAAYFVEELCATSTPHGRHASSVCFLSLLMGLKLGDYLVAERSRLPAPHARNVTSLGIGAMLHDVGMLRLPPDALGRWNRHHDESDPEWRSHAKIGFEMIRRSVDPSASAVVLHHHQAFDGSGFPRRRAPGGGSIVVAGQDIHVFARIVAVADAFDRMCNSADAPGAEKHPQQRRPNVAVLREMCLGPSAARFDPMVLRALMNCVPAYPPGSVVTLSSGEHAVVCNWRVQDPCRPRVLPIAEGLAGAVGVGPMAGGGILDAAEEPADTIDLAITPDLCIAEADGFDVSTENFLLPTGDAFSVDKAVRAQLNRAESLKAS